MECSEGGKVCQSFAGWGYMYRIESRELVVVVRLFGCGKTIIRKTEKSVVFVTGSAESSGS